MNTEDSYDFINVAGCDGLLRRMTLSTSDCSGMDDIPRIPCSQLNESLSAKVLALHNVCRSHHPINLKFRFGQSEEWKEQEHALVRILQADGGLQDEDFPHIFTGLDTASSAKDPDLLKLVKTLADKIAVETECSKDSSVKQEGKNLVSIMGQKAAKMHLVNSLVSNDIDQSREK